MSAHAGRSLGRYRLEAPLGQGGMAEVYRATDTKLARTVAVKVILATRAAEEHFLERFLREARTVASLEHPNILPVYDFGEEKGVPFLVMPYLSGGSLRERLKAGPAPLAVASAWIAQLAGALDAAHAAGVLHRDVKPANVLLGKDDRLFLADFGIAKMLENETDLTATGVVVGTPIYMAPEQAQGHPASRATDRYALAVVAYEILAGRPPFEGDNPLSLMHQHVSAPPPALSARVGGLPAGLDAVLSQALAKDPAARPPTCRALADAVAAFLPAGITPPTLRLPEPRPGLTSDQTVLTGPRRVARRAAFAGAGAVVALAGAWWVVAHRAAPAAPAAEPTTSAAAASSVAVVERTPVPTSSAKKAEPLVKRLADEDKRIADLEARVREAEAAAAQAAVAPKPVPPPPAVPDTSAVLDDPAHPLAAARARLDPARRPAHRLSREDFQFGFEEAQRVLGEHPRNPDARYLKMYARGGLAYVAGNDTAASDLLVKAFTEPRRAAKREAGPIASLLLRPDGTMGQPNGWELALGYGDARGEAMGLIEKELQASPRSAQALKARAYLRRMQGLDEKSPGDGTRRGLVRRSPPG